MSEQRYGPRYVTTWEMDARLTAMDHLITRLAKAVEGHERWHRDTMTSAATQGQTLRVARLSVIVSAVSAVAALVGVVVAVLALKG